MLGPVRRVVTGHDRSGLAVIRSDESFEPIGIPTGDAAFALIWTTASVPGDNNDETDGRARDAGLTLEKGSVLRIVDMLPGGVSPMHRTDSIDYGVVLSGRVELELDSGEKILLGPGDICVQRGTMHLWRTVGDAPCRVAFILIQAKPYLHNGEPLREEKP